MADNKKDNPTTPGGKIPPPSVPLGQFLPGIIAGLPLPGVSASASAAVPQIPLPSAAARQEVVGGRRREGL